MTKVTKPVKKAEESVSGLSENDHSPTVEESKDIDEKNVLKYMIESAMVYLQRSLAIMIKSVMSRLYGTTEVLQKLHEKDVQLQHLPKKSVEQCKLIASVNEIVQSSCKFWKSTSEAENCDIFSKDWVWHCRQMLPRKKDPQEEWKDLSEDLTSWKLDICFKLINRATHDGVQLFASQHLCFKTPPHNNYNFVELAEKATKVRNFYAHPSMYKDIIKQYAQDFSIIEDLAVKVFQWVKNEDNNPHNLSCCQEDVQHIQKRKKAYLNRYTAKWEEVSNGLKKLNFNDFAYILLATPCTASAGVGIAKEELAQLSNIPWAAIFDFDIASRQDGLWHSLCELEGDHLRLKVSCQSSSKNTVVPFSYADIDEAKKVELCRDGHIPWIFPHGELLNKSNEACPLNDYQLYQAVVRKPLIAAMRKIVNHITQNSSQGTVSVILCYGSYARDEKLPYKNFLSDLRYLCGELTVAGGHVIVLSDSLFLVKYFEPLPVLIFPLDIFCKMIRNKLTFGQGDLPPINMPTSVGLQPVTFEEEDFELIHEHIAEHEFYKHQVQEIIELRQQEKHISDSTIRSGIYYDLRERFYKGQRVTWISLNADHAITRREEKEITRSIRQMLQDRINEKIEPARYVIYHSGGAGATTLARKILWNLRTEFPCVILKSNYKHSDGKIQCTSQALKNLYEELQYPILMLIDEEPSFKTIPCLTSRVQANGTPVVFLQVQRFDPSESAAKSSKDSYILPNTLHKDDANNLKHKFLLTFGMDKIVAGDRSVAKMESSLAKPTEGDQVTDFTQYGTIAEGGVAHKKSGLSSYDKVKVIWDDGKEETCCIGSSDSKKYRLVYLITEIKTEINRLYQTFHFYGIMYLDEDFRKPMYEHIKKRLSVMLTDKKAQDDTFKKKLLILAYLSILFAFKVCESIHIKAFEHLCYAVTKSSKTDKFKLEAFIPEAALEFIIITREGQFRIIHPIVAHEIVKYYSLISSFRVSFPPSFVCKFLDYMLPEREYQHEEALLAVNRLLIYREYADNGIGHLTKKPFSELILTLDKQNPQHAVDVLDHASELINNCHSYGHYARYMSKKLQDYDRALEILKQAENLASQYFEEGIVLNIKGDVYREGLEKYLKRSESLNWTSSNNKAFDFHFKACQAYQESYKKNHEDVPLFNELVVRINLLDVIKKTCKLSERKFLEFVHCIPDTEVAKSIDTCFQLVKELNEYVCSGEGGKNLDSCSDEAYLKDLESKLLNILGSNKAKQKEILYDLMTNSKYTAYVNLPCVRRSYIHLCHLESNPTPIDSDTCLEHLESNFKLVGHVDRDMMNWLLITRNLPDVGGDTKKIEEKLLSWKHQGPCIIADKRNIQTTNNPVRVNFYLTVCYFIQLIEAEGDKVPLITKKFKDACHALKQESKDIKSRFWIKEWLHDSGTGFSRLRSGQPVRSELMSLTGSVGIPSWQEAQRSRGDKGFPYILWKDLWIPFDPKRNSNFKRGKQITFGVGFTLRGPQAIVFTVIESASSKPNSPRKLLNEGDEQRSFQITEDTPQTPAISYSQVTKGIKHKSKQPKVKTT